MIESNDFEKDLKKIIKENTYVSLDDDDFKDDTDLIVDLGYDSLSIVNLIADIEKYFKIEFEINELISEIIANYGNLKKCISRKIKKEV